MVGPEANPDKRDAIVISKQTIRRVAIIAAAVLVLAGIGVGAFLAGRSTAPTRQTSPKTGQTPTSTPATKPTTPASTTTVPATTTTVSPSTVIEASVQIVVCPTSFGITPPPAPKSLPASMNVSVPQDLANQVALYSDDQGTMMLLGPKGWICTGSYGADGSGGVAIYPTGEPVPNGQPFTPSSAEAIVGSETSACLSCREVQACPLFASAASDFEQDYGMSCPHVRPSAESVDQISAGVVGFTDPPDVAGDGNPSGGPYPANGVMTYYSGNENGSWLDTCTLPYSQQALCTTALNLFVSDYGDE